MVGICKNSKRLHPEDEITFYTSEIAPEKSLFKARVIEKRGEDGVLLEFLCPVDNLSKMLETYGMMPLPPYIKRENRLRGYGINTMIRKIIRLYMQNMKGQLPRLRPDCILPTVY